MGKGSLLLLCCVLSLSACDSTGPEESLPDDGLRYRTTLTDRAFGVTALDDGSFVLAGYTNGRPRPADGTTGYQPLLLRGRPNGTFAHKTIYSDTKSSAVRYGAARAVTALGSSDGLVVLARWGTDEREDRPRPLTLYRTDENGTRASVLFESSSVYAQDVMPAEDGGVLLHTYRSDGHEHDVAKLGTEGIPQWTYRLPGVPYADDVAQAPAGDLFVVGQLSESDGYAVARLRPDGAERWQRTFASERLQTIHEMVPARDDEGFALFGRRFLRGRDGDSTIVARFDGDGAMQWERGYTVGTGRPTAAALPGGGWAFAYAESYSDDTFGSTRAYVVQLAPDGTRLQRERFGPRNGTTGAADMAVLEGGALVVVGSTGPEHISGYGGDDFDVLAALYDWAP